MILNSQFELINSPFFYKKEFAKSVIQMVFHNPQQKVPNAQQLKIQYSI